MSLSSSTTVGDLLDLSKELENEGRIDGQVRLYNTDREDRIEATPERFLERTLTTDGLRRSLRILRDSLTGDDDRGTHLIRGPFGTGKSHQMLVLYHCLDAPEVARRRFGDELPGFDDALPDETVTVPISLQYSQPDQLWEPLFDALDHDPGSFETGGHPTIEDIMEAVGDQSVALFVDELERWFNTLNDDRREKTKGFLQSVLEAASEYENFHAFVSILQQGSDIYGILNREDSVSINMREEVDVRELIHHRLFESKPTDEDRIHEIVDDYVSTYEESDHVDVSDDLRGRMIEAYPFHPDLLDTIEEDYYAQQENQAARGMLFLLSKVVLAKHDETDLIVHGDLEPREAVEKDIGTELSHLDDDIHSACVDDIERVENAEIPYGPRVLTTILLYSLRPGQIEMIGAERSDIVVGTYHRGDNVSDIVRDINRITNGQTWHVHEKGGKFAIKESRTVSALIDDERVGVTRDKALDKIKDAITDVFDGGYAVVRDNDLTEVPDNKRTKVVIKADEWTAGEAETVITNGGEGRTYRNTLVFVQPKESVLDSNTIEKAKDLRAALEVKRNETLDPELRNNAKDRSEREQEDLRERIEIKYGEVLEGEDLLSNFEAALPTDLSVFGTGTDAEAIGKAMLADPFQVRNQIAEVVLGLLERRGEASITDIYEEFLRKPSLPIPESRDTILSVIDELEDESVYVCDKDQGFRDTFTVTSTTDKLVHADHFESWSTDDIRSELEQRLKHGKVNFDDFVDELRGRTDKRLVGDPGTAAEQLRDEGVCMFVSGRETRESPRGSVLRTDVEVYDKEDIKALLADEVRDSGQANVGQVLAQLPETVVLEDTQQAIRGAVEELLDEQYVLADDYTTKLRAGKNPRTATLVPTVDPETGDTIRDRIREYRDGDSFSLHDVAPDADERRARTFLLQNLGGSDPKYLIEGGSSNPDDWSPGTLFEIPGGTWSFNEFESTPEKLQDVWREQKEEKGEVTDGRLRFTLGGGRWIDDLGEVINLQTGEQEIRLTVEAGQPAAHVTRLFEELPDDATDIDAQFEFKK